MTTNSKAVCPVFERACFEIADKLNPRGYRAHGEGAQSLAELRVLTYEAHDAVTVSELHSDHTIFSRPEGNYAFRAWHEQRHLSENAEFDDAGERRVHAAMARDLAEWLAGQKPDFINQMRACILLECENIGQLGYWRAYGSPPDDQRTFALGYLAARGLL